MDGVVKGSPLGSHALDERFEELFGSIGVVDAQHENGGQMDIGFRVNGLIRLDIS